MKLSSMTRRSGFNRTFCIGSVKSPFGIAMTSLIAVTMLYLLGRNASEEKVVNQVANSSAETALTRTIIRNGKEQRIQLCEARAHLAGHVISGSNTPSYKTCNQRPGCGPYAVPWEIFAQGEYVGPHRQRHVPIYRLRVDDELEMIYRLTRNETSRPYELNVGDEVNVEVLADATLNRKLVIQPDGTITLPLLGQVRAAGRTVKQLTAALDERYVKYYNIPSITVTPIRVNTKLEDLRATVDSRAGRGGQFLRVRVTPGGTIQLPAIGSVPSQGLTLAEVKREVDERYAIEIEGIEVTPVLVARAPRFIYVLGEVRNPGRFELVGPTTLTQSIALAGSWLPGGNMRQVVVFRRTEDWQLIATKLNIMKALLGHDTTPCDEIWLRDSDIVIVPKLAIQRIDELIELVFVRGIYGVVPFDGISINMTKHSTI